MLIDHCNTRATQVPAILLQPISGFSVPVSLDTVYLNRPERRRTPDIRILHGSDKQLHVEASLCSSLDSSADVIQDIAHCALQYRTNLCDKNPVPAMAHQVCIHALYGYGLDLRYLLQCASWKTCMDRDPTKVGRAKVGAELIAEVVNGFVEPISWKTLVSISGPLPPDPRVSLAPYLSAIRGAKY
jgi:hypothetical protein